MTDDEHRILIDKSTGRPILMSPGRRGRPRNTGPDQDVANNCPFCEGSEALTTPELDAVRPADTAAGTPGWQTRAFANMYPAAACHEVIAEGPRHTTRPVELTVEEIADSLTLYRRRITAAEALTDVACTYLFKNVGADAGSSIAHNHSQLLGLESVPPRLVDELAASEAHGCIHCAEIADAEADGRLIYASEHHVIISSSTPKLPFEVWLVPLDHASDFLAGTHDEDLAQALHFLYEAVDRRFDSCPFNSYLHRIPGADFHWHFELQPRVGQLAGLELGADMYINAVTAQASAAHWRGE